MNLWTINAKCNPIQYIRKTYIINYVSDVLANDWYDYFDLALTMAKCNGGKYYLRHMRFPNGDYVSISDWLSMNK